VLVAILQAVEQVDLAVLLELVVAELVAQIAIQEMVLLAHPTQVQVVVEVVVDTELLLTEPLAVLV